MQTLPLHPLNAGLVQFPLTTYRPQLVYVRLQLVRSIPLFEVVPLSVDPRRLDTPLLLELNNDCVQLPSDDVTCLFRRDDRFRRDRCLCCEFLPSVL